MSAPQSKRKPSWGGTIPFAKKTSSAPVVSALPQKNHDSRQDKAAVQAITEVIQKLAQQNPEKIAKVLESWIHSKSQMRKKSA